MPGSNKRTGETVGGRGTVATSWKYMKKQTPGSNSTRKLITGATVGSTNKERDKGQDTKAKTRLSNRADKQAASYVKGSKEGKPWSWKEFGKKSETWKKMKNQ